MRHIQHIVLVISVVVLHDEVTEHLVKQLLVYRHEETLEIHLHYPTVPRIAFGTLPYIFLEHVDAEEHALLLAAVERPFAEYPLKQRLKAQDYVVVHNPVTETGGKHLAALRGGDDEGGADGWAVLTGVYLVRETDEVFLETKEILDGSRTLALMTEAVVVCLKHILVLNHTPYIPIHLLR